MRKKNTKKTRKNKEASETMHKQDLVFVNKAAFFLYSNKVYTYEDDG